MVVDASVALKWRFREVDSHLAERLLVREDLIAPDILQIETRYVITKLVRQRAISVGDARGPWLAALEARVALTDSGPLLEVAFELSLRLGAGFYDCVYLALAIETNDVMVTADDRFVRSVRTDRTLQRSIVSLADV